MHGSALQPHRILNKTRMRDLVHHANALHQNIITTYYTNTLTPDTTRTLCANALHTYTTIIHFTHALYEDTARQRYANTRHGRATPIHATTSTIMIRVVAWFQGGLQRAQEVIFRAAKPFKCEPPRSHNPSQP